MAKAKTSEWRIHPKETRTLEGLEVTNRTDNSITVRRTSDGLVVTNCCLEEQGM
jgi:hypothetical protein